MTVSIAVSAIAVLLMIISILLVLKIRIGKVWIDVYWLIAAAGAAVLLLIGESDAREVLSALTADTAINPLKILVLFLSMTILSVFLDELGFFRYLAELTLKRAKASQTKLFIYLYLIVSVLTVFTSNDVIILSFTPFICYFSKEARISPMPYLAAEFVAANTWSMALMIGNPTNIYLSTAYGIGFLDYVKVMLLPTLAGGLVAFCALFLIYRKKLSDPITGEPGSVTLNDRLLLWIGIAHLAVCTAALAVSSYIGLEMWLISLCAVISLFAFQIVIAAVRHKKPEQPASCLRRAPWQLVPFVLSMFIMIIVLSDQGVTASIASLLGSDLVIVRYGIASFLSANVINNIPMSVLFCRIAESLPQQLVIPAVYASVIGSNLGAFFTPIGALAGIMWSSILHRHGLKFGYFDFLKIGFTIALPTLAAALAGLWLSL